MQAICNFIKNQSWLTIIVVSLTLGLAPFYPEPHIWEKLKMLSTGTLSKPIDIFDLFLHGLPWLALILKASLCRGKVESSSD